MTFSHLTRVVAVLLCLSCQSILLAKAQTNKISALIVIEKSNLSDSIPISEKSVDLSYFNGQTRNINTIHLEWVTAKEHKNRGFEIQRSVDGIDFQSIGFIEALGDGNSTKRQQYNFMDDQLPGGKYFYRLKQMGFKEIVTYSPIVPILIQDFKDNFLAYPSSTNGDFYISSTQWRSVDKRLSYELVDLKGKILYNSGFTSEAAFLLSLKPYPVGAYYVLVRNESKEVIGQLRIQKG